MRTFIFFVLAFFALLFGIALYYQNAPFVISGTERGFLLTKEPNVLRSIYLPAFYVHIITGSLVLISGVFQLSRNLRQRYPRCHRYAGRFYVAVVLILTAPSGFVMALYANGGRSSQLCFVLLALCWWYFTFVGWRKALQRDWPSHRRFMLRSYVLTFAAVMLRMYSFIFALAGFRGEGIYSVIVWLSWVPSLIVIELWFRKRNSGIIRFEDLKFEDSKIERLKD
jgi:uncharacterized membrane protein YozB (DUF420 family)